MTESNRASTTEVVTLTSLMRELKAIEEHVQKIDGLYSEQAKLSQDVAKVSNRIDNVCDEIGKMNSKISDMEGVQMEYGQMLANRSNQKFGNRMAGHNDQGYDYSKQKGGLCNFMYDSETKTVMGRSGKQWFQLIVFYIIFYAALIGFWIACLYGFLSTTNEKMPSLLGLQSMLQLNPAMGYRPQPDFETNFIKFNASDPNTFSVSTPKLPSYLADANSFLAPYFDEAMQAKLTNCTGGQRASEVRGCQFRPLLQANTTGCFRESAPPFGLGYAEAKPCIILKMNRIIGWMPKNGPNNTFLDVKLRCVGENEADNETLGAMEYSPGGVDANGPYGLIESKYFPYMNQPYLSPFVVVRFSNVKLYTVALIWCQFDSEAMDFAGPNTFWASRVLTERAGGIHFELLVDSAPRKRNSTA